MNGFGSLPRMVLPACHAREASIPWNKRRLFESYIEVVLFEIRALKKYGAPFKKAREN